MNRVGDEKAFVYTRGRRFRLMETLVPCAPISDDENEKGERPWNESRWAGTLVQESGRWHLLANHGGSTDMLE